MGRKREAHVRGVAGHWKGRKPEKNVAWVSEFFPPPYEAHVWKSLECKHVAIVNHLKQNKFTNLGEISLNLMQMRENAAGKYLMINSSSPLNHK